MLDEEDDILKKKNFKSAYDPQRMKIERLMQHPEKPVTIPNPSKERKPREPFEFIRNVWGSSSGVGSGDFHIYRGIRRREYERQAFNEKKLTEEKQIEEFEKKVVELRKLEEEKSAKKRAKRLKKKARQKAKKSSGPDKDDAKTNSDKSESDTELS